jgi:hypothetical protein
MAYALQERLGRSPGDPDVRMFAAAAVGALLTVADHDLGEIETMPDVEAFTHRLDAAIARLGRMLVLPENGDQ